MDGGKTVALLLIVIALAGIYLQSGGQLQTLFKNLQSSGNGNENLAVLGIAIVIYILILSILPDNYAVPVTAVVLLGALLVNHQKRGSNDLITSTTNLLKGVKI